MEYGLIGEKLGHSFSKEIHNQIGNYNYELKEIPKTELEAFIKERNFKGINVTIPYKQDVIPFLDFVDDAAKEIGAVNTVVNREGKLFGYNTDFIGLKRLILSKKIDIEGKKVLILGTGGTSKTATAVAKSLKAGEIFIVSRKESPKTITYEQAVSIHKDANIIINTTPCGMFPKIDETPISLESFEKLECVVDVIYNPLRTQLVLQALEYGINAIGGLYMLFQQAIAAEEYFFEKSVSFDKVEKIFKKIESDKKNIVLVGMPGCGKSTVGKKLASELNREYFDTDELITKKYGKTPADIICEKGEKAFRDIEAQICAEISMKQNVVISTGGGAVLRSENIFNLKKNGTVFFIDRNIDKIKPTGNRPLSDSRKKLEEVYKVRYPIYTKCADFCIKSDENISHTVEAIKSEI